MEAGYSYETLLRMSDYTASLQKDDNLNTQGSKNLKYNIPVRIYHLVECGASQHDKSSSTFRRDVLAPPSGLESKLCKQELCFLLACCLLFAFLFGLVYGGSIILRKVSHREIVTSVKMSNPHTALRTHVRFLLFMLRPCPYCRI
jgi:hypothetical protein